LLMHEWGEKDVAPDQPVSAQE